PRKRTLRGRSELKRSGKERTKDKLSVGGSNASGITIIFFSSTPAFNRALLDHAELTITLSASSHSSCQSSQYDAGAGCQPNRLPDSSLNFETMRSSIGPASI